MISFEDAYLFMWLARSKVPYRHLSFSANQFRERIEAALVDGIIPIDPMLDGIIEISNGSTDPFERAEIHLVCARSYFLKEAYDEALNHLDSAVQAYTADPYNQAVVFWMKGCVVLEMKGNNVDTILFWQRSLGMLNSLAKSLSVHREGAEWFVDWREEMEDSLAEVISKVI